MSKYRGETCEKSKPIRSHESLITAFTTRTPAVVKATPRQAGFHRVSHVSSPKLIEPSDSGLKCISIPLCKAQSSDFYLIHSHLLSSPLKGEEEHGNRLFNASPTGRSQVRGTASLLLVFSFSSVFSSESHYRSE